MKLIINGCEICAPIETILEKVRKISPNYLSEIRLANSGDDVTITCPFHKSGHENRPSCNVYCRNDNPNVEYGFFNCFTCGSKGPLYKLVSFCTKHTDEWSKEWLVNNFGEKLDDFIELPEISLPEHQKTYLDESVLNEFDCYHPYMWQRKLSKEVVDTFRVGYDNKINALTFPVWDASGRLVMVTKRNVDTKRFYIPSGIEKPVYLLNFVQKWGMTEVWVMESQINALYGWSMGYPSIGLIGTGSKTQYDILKKSGIRTFHLCLDGDEAGDLGSYKFKEAMPNSIQVDVVEIPRGKDVNDLSFEEFSKLRRKF